MTSLATSTRPLRRMLAALIATTTVSGPVSADTVVAPGAFANTPGTVGLNTLIRNIGNPRTYQMIIDDSQLASMPVGVLITGVQWRAQVNGSNNPPSWPVSSGYGFNDYNMWLAPAATAVGSMSTTFANNVGPGEVQVFDGPLTIPVGSFLDNEVAGVPNPWGYLINFTTPYLYTGGDLVFTARHPGSNSVSESNILLDAITIAESVPNGVQTMAATSNTATSGALSNSTIFQFTYTVVPGPSAIALIGLGFVGAGRSRRRDSLR